MFTGSLQGSNSTSFCLLNGIWCYTECCTVAWGGAGFCEGFPCGLNRASQFFVMVLRSMLSRIQNFELAQRLYKLVH